MTGLVEFLRARLDERAAAAEEVQRTHPGPWRYLPDEYAYVRDATDSVVMYDEGALYPAGAMFIAANDPAAVLADVAAKRALIEEIEGLETQIDGEWGNGTGFTDSQTALRFLAAPFAGHPEFDPAWAVPGEAL